MKIVKTIEEVRASVSEARKQNKKIGFVPTMGYLHEGHTSLVKASAKFTDYQVMSIFVNKIQFNNISDFDTYPRDLERDFDYAKKAGVDLIFTPDDKEMYKDQQTHVDVDTLTDHLCGAYRPGHFRGVFTVVSKLFNIVLPDYAVFGQKDIQQAVSIEKMVSDLNFPVKIIISPIIREKEGLAMSSRNKHLSDVQRKKSYSIFISLQKAEELVASGEKSASNIIDQMQKIISGSNPDKIDYITVADYSSLQPVTHLNGKCVIAVAAFFGTTRLIDNMIIEIKDGTPLCIY